MRALERARCWYYWWWLIQGVATHCGSAQVRVCAAEEFDYDLVIIGAGVGGHGAALHAVDCGLKTAIIEGGVMGGTCVNRGCIPSKALLAASGRVREMKNEMHLKQFGIQVTGLWQGGVEWRRDKGVSWEREKK